MDETLKKVIQDNAKGLFLLDPPTGFGKTFTVNSIIRNFLTNPTEFPNTKRMFFITNLKGNISYCDVVKELSDEERKKCLYARALSEAVIDNFLKVDISLSEITSSKEYNDLKADIEAYHSLLQLDKETLTKNDGIRKSLNALENKISCDTEPSFRKFIKNRYFYNKSSVEKKKFVRDNVWLRLLYPICDVEKYKVVFMTTKRFVLPFDTFQRMPFYLYDDDITKDSIIFIDEFDATKGEILNQIIEDGIKNKIDIVKLFIDINFALQNLVIPQKLLHTSAYHKSRQIEVNWKETQEHFKEWREKFAKLFEECNINYLIKSVGLDADRTFLFDDGRSFNVIKDSSKKFLYTNLDQDEQILALKGLSSQLNKEQVGVMIRKLENHIDGFARILFYVANNYMYYKNEPKDNFETKYTFEEALFTVLDALNLNDEEKEYLFKKVFNYDFSFQKPSIDDGIRRGFNYTEIEDSDYHDAKSIIHNYNFHTTPEDIVVKLSNKALVVGISATARIKTCIGNYDLSYLSKRLGTLMIDVDAKDYERIATEFNKRLEITSGYHIHTQIIDDVNCFSNREKCKEIICTIFNSIDLQDKYLAILEDSGINSYYFLIELKLATIYYDMKQKRFKSFVAFLNGFPKDHANDGINRQRLLQLFSDIDIQYNEFPIIVEIVKASNYSAKMQVIHQELSLGKAVFVLTTYNTIGSGRNIQYPIPKSEIDNVIMSPLDKHGTKDFEAIYLLTPTNLIQSLSYKSDHKYDELAKFLFQQEYLYYNGQLTYYEMKNNISNGFRHTFYYEKDAPFYTKNGDMYDNSLRLIIQAIGRICRCQNKNKDIYVYSDKEVVERIKIACEKSTPKLLNAEFNALLQMDIGPTKISGTLTEYSRQSKKSYVDISKAAYNVRRSVENVKEWKLIRDYVLRNPTTDSVSEKYAEHYFKFDDRYTGYCYKFGCNYNIADIKTDLKYSDMQQVSDQDCDLSLILNAKPYLMDFFQKNNYVTTFKKGYYIMNPSLYKQIYWGALGEVVGREILDKELGWDLEELEDVSMYEYFDFKLGNIYFDFKHWDDFRADNNKYVQKIERKLDRVKGAKCFVINIVKRTDAKPKVNIGNTVVQIPYLIDAETGLINDEAIEYIQELYDRFLIDKKRA